jgi:homoserine kinase
MGLLTTPVAVRVPATSANLGPGFDALGLALTLYDDVRARLVDRAGVHVTIAGEGAGELPTDERHLVVQTLKTTLERLGVALPGLELACRNRIPQARGLGSSSAAIVAGILLGRALVEGGAEAMDDAAVLRLAAEIEGHADNVAPCLLGGLTLSWTDESGARAVRVEPSTEVRPFLLVPEERGLTETARAALPKTVPHADAAFNAARSALLVHALTAQPVAPDLLFAATEDRLHQPYRAAGQPATAALVRRLREAGAAAVVSGAGPSVLVLGRAGNGAGWTPEPIAGWRVWPLEPDTAGALLVDGSTWGTLEDAERDPVAASWAS